MNLFDAAVTVLLMAATAQQPASAKKDVSASAGPNAQLPSTDELVRLGGSLSDLRRYDEAINAFTLALQLDPKNGDALADRGLDYAWTNRLEEAERDFTAAEQIIGDKAVIHRGRALVAMRRSDGKTALVELSKSLEKEPGNPFALSFRAWLNQDAHNEDAAIDDAEAYIKSHPESADAYELKAELLQAQGKRDQAIVEAGQLTNFFGQDAYALSAAARVYDAAGQRSRAMDTIGRAISLNPNFAYYYYLRSKFRRWNDFEERRQDLFSALTLAPGDLDTVTQMGLVEFKQRYWSEAVSRFSTVLQKEPKDFGVLAYRAAAYLGWGKVALAEKDYEAAMAAASGADDFSKVCWAFANEGVALDWALKACNRAIALKQSEGAYFRNRGLIELRQSRFDEAVHDYDRAIELNPRSSEAYYGRALARIRKGETKAANVDREQALAINPKIDETYEEYGVAGF